jgi:crossover junction endodeoxyribonuclease RuvC
VQSQPAVGVTRTLGIDPGTAIMGYGVVESTGKGGVLRAVAYGALTTSSADPLAVRLRYLHSGLGGLFATYAPAALAVESLFFNLNVRTALAVGHARGVALLAAAEAGVEVFEYSPQQVKGAVVGYGKASKEQVQAMIKTLLALEAIPRPDDAADALAVAICHVHSAALSAAALRAAGR